ncbi:MAG: hypothetical protein QG626_900 [Patescibacteria group bacterium]|jgi:hypothetical protein|nr:hypothetical protein [Patescibacteria group bacterium]
MLCGDISQVPAEVNAGITAVQAWLAMPIIVWMGIIIRGFYKDIKNWIKKIRGKNTKSKNQSITNNPPPEQL